MFDNSAVFNQPATLKMMKCALKHFLRKKSHYYNMCMEKFLGLGK